MKLSAPLIRLLPWNVDRGWPLCWRFTGNLQPLWHLFQASPGQSGRHAGLSRLTLSQLQPCFWSLPWRGDWPGHYSVVMRACPALAETVSLGYTLPSCGHSSLGVFQVTFLCVAWYTCMCAKLLQSCPNFCDPTDCSRPGSSVHGMLQARILEWVAMPSSRGSSRPGIKPVSPNVFCRTSSLPLASPGKPRWPAMLLGEIPWREKCPLG